MEIKYKDKIYECVLDFKSIARVCQRINIKFSDFGKEMYKLYDDPKSSEILFEESLKRGANKNGEKLDHLSEFDLDDMYNEYMTVLFNEVKKVKEAESTDDSKKN